jgi:hypothetical protein
MPLSLSIVFLSRVLRKALNLKSVNFKELKF